MTSTNGAAPSRIARRFWFLGLGVAVVVALYTAAWFYGADRLKAVVRGQLSDASLAVACTGLDVRGYPFRIGVFCDSLGLDDSRTGTSASFGALRSAAQVYRPGHAVVELDGPAQVRVAPDMSLDADWDLLHASVVAGTAALERVSVAYDALRGTFTPGMGRTPLTFTVRHGEMHTRENGAALDAALSLTGLELKVADTAVPSLDAAVDLSIEGAAGWLASGPPENAPRDTKGELRRFGLDFGNGNTAVLSGPYAIDEEGLLSGRFELRVNGIDSVRDLVKRAFPELADTADSVTQTIRGLSGGSDDARVRLKVDDGVVYLGFIPIAAIPPL
ncbi:DUF2125 domain-containing protein [Mycoplana sp. MJR14]|uniref:DUF2125 domain-containing protein n=1 Tax=Mycoplana sp. MJR14 TaxID=3032583 RepID=UPI0023DB7B2B|nr:DUF2125 domain-containing protein [Mycoplana sp. MJR14]MDF1633442.1 DUF2125 domain-containing protein [Mycoplana sp. MJR14]